MFRAACLLFAVALITPTLVNVYLFRGANPLTAPARPGTPPDQGVAMFLSAIAPTTFMVSFLLAIDSVTPRYRPGAAPVGAGRVCARCGRMVDSPFCPYCNSPTVDAGHPPAEGAPSRPA
jgi:hypothetical protein